MCMDHVLNCYCVFWFYQIYFYRARVTQYLSKLCDFQVECAIIISMSGLIELLQRKLHLFTRISVAFPNELFK